MYKNTIEGAKHDEEMQFESRSCGTAGTTGGVDPRRKKLATFAGRAVCAVVMAAVVGAVGVQSAAAETEAEAVSKSHRVEINGCFEQYEEGIKQIKAGATQDGEATIWAATYVLSKAMKYKEWTKADSDRYSALKKRYEQAVAEAASKARRREIGMCLELYEEGIKEIEAGNEQESQATIWAATSSLSAVMKYKEWTKADDDKYSALKQRHEQALKKPGQAQAAAAATTPRGKIDAYLNLVEEVTETFEAGDIYDGINKGMQLAKMGDASVLMQYKEWTQADSDRLAALSERYQNAVLSDGQKAYVKKAMEEPHASQELLDAIFRDDAAAIQKLIAQGEDPNGVVMGTPTPVLWKAVSANKPKAARALIESGADVLFKLKGNNETILHPAAFYGGRELLTLLLDSGAKKYVNEVSGNTPAMMAARNVNLEALKALMAYGADLNKKDYNGRSILLWVCDSASQNAAGRLEDSKDIKAATKMFEQAKKNEADFLSFLIKSGVNKKADLSAAFLEGYYMDNPAAMKILIDAGADVNCVGESGRTPLFETIYTAYMAEEGYKQGDGVWIHTTLYYIESIKLLIASGANVNARDEHGNTPLHQASMSFRGFTDLPEIIRILIAAGAKVDARNNDGKTPLMVAAGNNAAENAEALIAAGADVNAKDKGGHTPLYYATGPGCYKAAPVIRYYGGVGEYK